MVAFVVILKDLRERLRDKDAVYVVNLRNLGKIPKRYAFVVILIDLRERLRAKEAIYVVILKDLGKCSEIGRFCGIFDRFEEEIVC